MTTFLYTIIDTKKNSSPLKHLIELGKWNWLISYHFLSKKKDVKTCLEELTEDKPKDSIFMLDSGAYSAYSQGIRIDIWAYIEFIKEYHEFFTRVVALDVVGNPINSEVNNLIMRKELVDYPELTIVPVFHSRESFKVLDYFIEQGYKYIGIGVNKDWEEKGEHVWLNEVYSQYDFDALGIGTHGFAASTNNYPLTTCDSTSFIKFSVYGRILVPSGLPHIFDIPDDTQDDFINSICDKVGVTVSQMKKDKEENGREARIRFNIEALDRIFQMEKKVKVQETSGMLDLFAGSDFGSIPFNVKTLNEKYQYALSLGKEYTGYL
jgi:hypothetical protein